MALESGPSAISVVIPVKNRACLLADTVRSLMAQSHAHWEALVVDDCSRPDEREMIREIIADCPRIRLIVRPSGAEGAPVCRNLGLANSSSQLVMFLDSDDVLDPDCLAGRVKVMEENPDVGFAVFATELFRTHPGDLGVFWNTLTNEDDLLRFLRGDVPWATPGPVWRKEILIQLAGWDESARLWQDWEMHVRALAAGIPYLKVGRSDNQARVSSPDSIGLRTDTDESVRDALLEVIGIATRELQLRERLSSCHQQYLAGLHYRLARACFYHGASAQGLRVWDFCRKRRLVSSWQYAAVRMCWALSRWPIGRWWADQYLWRRCRPYFQVHSSVSRGKAQHASTMSGPMLPVIAGIR